MAIYAPVWDEAEFDRILIKTLAKRDKESMEHQTPKLVEARKLHAKAIQKGISRHTDLAVKKEETYYPVLGGFEYVLITSNPKLLEILKPSGLSVEFGCPYCVSSPNCVLEREFRLNMNCFVHQYGDVPRTLYDLFAEIMEGPRPRDLKQMTCQEVARDALNKPDIFSLPQCVLGDILDL